MPLRPNERLLVGKDSREAACMAADAVVSALTGRPGPVSVALAGGSTPALLYSTLGEAPCRDRLPWREVYWFWADERAVPPEHPDSNYRMAAENLLGPLGIEADHIQRMPADRKDLDQAAAEYEQTIRSRIGAARSGMPLFDLILLGVGADGHTASLFPGTPALRESRRLVVSNYAPRHNAWRMTMTFPLLNAARAILFFVTGSGKAEIMARILSEPPADLPAAALRDAPERVTWVLDAEAARLVRLLCPE
jgi:6-phosphogluconolactonase